MQNLFDPADRASIERRVMALQASSARQWGTMNPAQAMAHCVVGLEMACGDRPKKQALLGRVITPFIRSFVLGEAPMRKNAPTGPEFVIADERNLATEQQRVTALVDRFCQRGPSAAATAVHRFFGRLSGEEWGRLMYKHLDHHLRQFGG